MKLFRNSIYMGIAVATVAIASSCSEDDTLSGAKAVYITLDPAAVNLSLGDTVKVSASVSNISGDEISTPISWTIDDESVAKVVEFRDTVFTAGDTIYTALPDSTQFIIPREVKSIGDKLYTGVVANPGSQGKSTLLRATLSNGKFAVATVTVTNHSPSGVTPLSENVRVYRPSDVMVRDTVWFAVEPWAIVEDYVPTFKLTKTDDGPSQMTADEDAVVIDHANKHVGVVLLPDRSYGEYDLSLTIGGNGDVVSGSTTVTVGPGIKVGMWDPDVEGMSAPSGDQFYGFNYEVRKTVDINSEVKVWARLMVEGGRPEDIANAHTSYSWDMVSGNSLMITGMEEISNEYGFDCVLTLRAGISTGDNVINFCSPDTAALTMSAYITVLDYNKDYPVKDIVVTPNDPNMSLDNLVASAAGNLELDVKVDPLTSLAYHRPEVTVANPEILEFVSYTGTLMTFRGIKPGTTTFTLKSLDIEKTFSVTVVEEIVEINWLSAADRLVAGQTDVYSINVRTASGETNTLPVVWKSSNPAVLEVTGSGETASVKAVAEGTATITATITSATGKVTTATRMVTVTGGLDDIIVTDADFDAGGDAGYYSNGGRAGFYVSLPAKGYNNIWIYTKEVLSNFNGLMAADIFSDVDFDGSAATVTASTLTLSGYNAATGEATATGDITLSLGGAPVKIVFDNVLLYCMP